jgi:hypothetical protein
MGSFSSREQENQPVCLIILKNQKILYFSNSHKKKLKQKKWQK